MHALSRTIPWLALAAALATAALAAGVLAPPAEARAQAAAKCPLFHVLHNDRVGDLRLPQGWYRIKPFNPDKLSCAKAASLFAQFLQDFDGNLPGRWRVRVKKSAFQRGRSDVGFYVKRTGNSGGGGGGGGKHPAEGRACPNLFTVLHNDRIGKLDLPKGKYRITLLRKLKPSCQRAATLFAQFLERPDGKLPAPWKLDPETATFKKRPGVGFRVKRVR
jgi:hypothetical protein